MSAKAWVQLALKGLGCSQKELALRLGVSPGQISKWKSDEHMSFDMEAKFRELTGITDHFPDFVLAAGTIEEAGKWEKLILHIAELAQELGETGYITAPLDDEPDLLCWKTFSTLESMGVSIPDFFPIELNSIINTPYYDEIYENIDNFHYKLILEIFKSLNDVYGFYAAYISELVNDDDGDSSEIWETGAEIEACLMDLAATKIEIDSGRAPNFGRFKYDTVRMYEKWIKTVQAAALRSGRPLRAELFDLIDQDHDALGSDAEAESLGFNKSRLHPDVYMNELLVGMRAIHQVLPAIIAKLGISEDELNFDTTQLRR